MNLLEGFEFSGGLLLSFEVDRYARNILIRMEAVFPESYKRTVRKGVIEIQLMNCTNVNLKATPEFWLDLEWPYDPINTVKANEITSASLTRVDDQHLCRMESDMAVLVVECGHSAVTPY